MHFLSEIDLVQCCLHVKLRVRHDFDDFNGLHRLEFWSKGIIADESGLITGVQRSNFDGFGTWSGKFIAWIRKLQSDAVVSERCNDLESEIFTLTIKFSVAKGGSVHNFIPEGTGELQITWRKWRSEGIIESRMDVWAVSETKFPSCYVPKTQKISRNKLERGQFAQTEWIQPWIKACNLEK